MSDTVTRYRLHESLGYQLSITARQQEKRLDEGFRKLGLTRTTWCVLLAVANEGLQRPSEIADFVGIDRTATSRALRQLDDAGLVARCAGTEDRRTTTVELTSEGHKHVLAGTPMAEANADQLAAALSGDEAETLKRLLRKLRGTGKLNLDRI